MYLSEISVLSLFLKGMETYVHKEPCALIFLAAEYFALFLKQKHIWNIMILFYKEIIKVNTSITKRMFDKLEKKGKNKEKNVLALQ